MGFKKNNPGCNCCAADCGISSDDFAGAVTDNFTVQSGSWATSGGVLQCTSAGAIICNSAHPDGDISMVVQVDFSHDTSGSTCDVKVAEVDSTHYFYVRYTVQGGSGLVDIRRKNGASDFSLASASATINTSTVYTAKVCVSAGHSIIAFLNGATKVSVANSSLSGTKAGLAATGSGTATFDNWLFVKNYNSSNAPDCDRCLSDVSTCSFCSPVPSGWQVVVSGGSAYDGTYFVYPDIFYQHLAGEQCVWAGTASTGGCAAVDSASVGISSFSNTTAFQLYKFDGTGSAQWRNALTTDCTDGMVIAASGITGTCANAVTGSTATCYKI